MKEQLLHILDKSVCLSRGQVGAYIKGTMEPEEVHAAEVHISSCSLCSMAIDGYDEHKEEGLAALETLDSNFLKTHFDKALPQIHLNSIAPAINNSTDKATSKTISFFPWQKVAGIAAVLLISAGAYWYLSKTDFDNVGSNQVAMANEPSGSTENNEDGNGNNAEGALSGSMAYEETDREAQAAPSASRPYSATDMEGNSAESEKTDVFASDAVLDTRVQNGKAVSEVKSAPKTPSPARAATPASNATGKSVNNNDKDASAEAAPIKTGELKTSTKKETLTEEAEETRRDVADRHEETIEKAKKLIEQGKEAKARKLLQSVIDERGPKWREARRLMRKLDKE